MCGINGIYAYNSAAPLPDEDELLRTRDRMAARGPDDKGSFWCESRRLGMGHRRLSIIDPSAAASQPMTSYDGRYTIVFNGEIYNYLALRNDLQKLGYSFRTKSDTEVLLYLYHHFGVRMVQKLRGMFAIAIWDNETGALFLARDPYGIKPLYVANDGWTFRFASQVKALQAGGRLSTCADPAGVVGFLLWGNVPEPFTLYQDISAFPPGHTQIVDEVGPRAPVCYASISEIMFARVKEPVDSDPEAAVRELLLDSVSRHLVADVDVGVFLSAGVDSGALLGLMRDAGHANPVAVTLEFEEFKGTSEHEGPLAAKVAKHYGAEHIIETISKQDYQHSWQLFLEAMDQPSIDGMNTWFVSKVAKQAGLKVALTGAGGDEIFAGYPGFQEIPKLRKLAYLPSLVPGVGAAFSYLSRWAGVDKRWPKFPGILSYGGSWEGSYLLRRALFLPEEIAGVVSPAVAIEGLERLDVLAAVRKTIVPKPRDSIGLVSVLESSNYLKNQLLRDADWAGMAHSIELRMPFVDINLLQGLSPFVSGFSGGRGKQLLAKAPRTPLPNEVVKRGKTGFVLPLQQWLVDTTPGSATKSKASRQVSQLVLREFMDPSVIGGSV